MLTLYNLLKFLHVASVIIWIGGVSTLGIINARLARKRDRDGAAVLARQGSFYGQSVIAPAAGITLIAGIGMSILARISFSSLWIIWGLAGIFFSMALGAIYIRRVNEEISRLILAPEGVDEALANAQQRLANLNLINLALLLSVVLAMVFKPAL